MAPVASSSASSLEGLGGFGSVSGWADKAFGQGLSSLTKGSTSTNPGHASPSTFKALRRVGSHGASRLGSFPDWRMSKDLSQTVSVVQPPGDLRGTEMVDRAVPQLPELLWVDDYPLCQWACEGGHGAA